MHKLMCTMEETFSQPHAKKMVVFDDCSCKAMYYIVIFATSPVLNGVGYYKVSLTYIMKNKVSKDTLEDYNFMELFSKFEERPMRLFFHQGRQHSVRSSSKSVFFGCNSHHFNLTVIATLQGTLWPLEKCRKLWKKNIFYISKELLLRQIIPSALKATFTYWRSVQLMLTRYLKIHAYMTQINLAEKASLLSS